MNKLSIALKHFGERTQTTLRSFPVTLSLLIALTAVLITYVAKGFFGDSATPPRWMFVSLYYLSVAVVLDFGLSLWMEELKTKRTGIFVRMVAGVIWTAYCIWLYFFAEKELTLAFTVANLAWITAFTLLIPFISFWRERTDIKAWHMLLSLALAAIIVDIIVGVMTAGSLGLLAGIQALFDVHVSGKLYAYVLIVCSVLLGGFLFLYLTPTGERKHNTETAIHPFLLGVMKCLILPLLGCYMVVLYVYMCSIIFHWELPKGTLSVMVSVVMLGYVLTYVVLYPRIKNGNDTLAKLINRWAPILILPLLVLMTVGIGRRIHDYGITAPRLYVLTLNIWYYVICLVILLAPRKRFHWVFLSFAALFLLSSGLPVNYYSISKRVIVNRITRVLQDNNISIQKDNLQLYETLKSAIGKEEAQSILEDIDYLHDTYKYEGINAWMEKYDSWKRYKYLRDDTDIWTTISDYSRRDVSGNSWTQDALIICPEGYQSFKEIHSPSRGRDSIPLENMQNGILPISWRQCNDSITIWLDTKEIVNATENNYQLSLRAISRDSFQIVKENLFIPNYVNIQMSSDSTYSIDFGGYLFEK